MQFAAFVQHVHVLTEFCHHSCLTPEVTAAWTGILSCLCIISQLNMHDNMTQLMPMQQCLCSSHALPTLQITEPICSLQAFQRLGIETIPCKVRKANQNTLKMHMMWARWIQVAGAITWLSSESSCSAPDYSPILQLYAVHHLEAADVGQQYRPWPTSALRSYVQSVAVKCLQDFVHSTSHVWRVELAKHIVGFAGSCTFGHKSVISTIRSQNLWFLAVKPSNATSSWGHHTTPMSVTRPSCTAEICIPGVLLVCSCKNVEDQLQMRLVICMIVCMISVMVDHTGEVANGWIDSAIFNATNGYHTLLILLSQRTTDIDTQSLCWLSLVKFAAMHTCTIFYSK